MPFCPNCRYEYRTGNSTCPDCNEPLVAELPPESSTERESDSLDEQDWVRVAVLTLEHYALLVQEGLRQQGIPIVVMSNAGMLGQSGQMGFGLFNQGSSGYQIYVPETWVEDAHAAAEALLGDEWTKSRVD